MPRPAGWPNPLDHPLAVAAAGLLLVVLSQSGLLSPGLALPLAIGVAFALAFWRDTAGRAATLRDRRVAAAIDAALLRCQQLAAQAQSVAEEALARFQADDHLEQLGEVQLCCQRLQALPQRIAERRPLLESGGGVLLPAEQLAERLQQEEQALQRERNDSLRRERRRLVDQLRRNLQAAQLGMDERDARLLALATRLERIDGGLRQLQGRVQGHWSSREGDAAALGQAISPLDEALDQIERLLELGHARE
jgi:hypothetical protein